MPDSTKSSRDILKLVDQLVKSNNLDKAMIEVRKARELDPKNIYAFAYEERIKELFAQRKEQELLKLKPPEPSPPPKAESLKPYDVKEQIIIEETKVPALYEEFKKAGLRRSEENRKDRVQRASKDALDIYKQALMLAWSDGQKTGEEVNELQYLKKSLYITDEEHGTLDRQARLECYILLLKHLLQSNASKAEVAGYLAELRRSFDVTNSEHDIIEANLVVIKEGKGRKQLIVVVDDEKQMLTLIKDILVQVQYEVEEFTTSDDAYEFLKKQKVDCILCDINLETSSMNGFLFYEKIREMRHLQQAPFIFITGLNDVVLMRAGKEMGVDDFLIKPVHRENLLATIRGRIKRYEQIRLMSGL
jgi:PleD family two-component response regulator